MRVVAYRYTLRWNCVAVEVRGARSSLRKNDLGTPGIGLRLNQALLAMNTTQRPLRMSGEGA